MPRVRRSNPELEALKKELTRVQQLREEEREQLKEVLSERKLLTKAIREASAHRHAVMLLDPNRNYVKEIKALLLEKTKGLADPKFEEKGKEILVAFGDYGPRYKLRIAGPFKRIRAKLVDTARSL